MIRRLNAAFSAVVVASLLAVTSCGDDDGSSPAETDDGSAVPIDPEDDSPTTGQMIDPPLEIGNVSLPELGAGRANFPLRADPGKLLLVFFGYTNCPDFCPGTMANVKLALGKLGDRAGDVDLAMVTVDPDRDLKTLAQYVQSYVPNAHALGTKNPVALQKAADAFGVAYTVGESPEGQQEVGHTTSLFGVDENGALVITWTFGITPSQLADDLTYLLDQTA